MSEKYWRQNLKQKKYAEQHTNIRTNGSRQSQNKKNALWLDMTKRNSESYLVMTNKEDKNQRNSSQVRPTKYNITSKPESTMNDPVHRKSIKILEIIPETNYSIHQHLFLEPTGNYYKIRYGRIIKHPVIRVLNF